MTMMYAYNTTTRLVPFSQTPKSFPLVSNQTAVITLNSSLFFTSVVTVHTFSQNSPLWQMLSAPEFIFAHDATAHSHNITTQAKQKWSPYTPKHSQYAACSGVHIN